MPVVHKGQIALLSHTFSIAFTILLIVVIVTTMNSLKLDYQEFVGKEEVLQACVIVKSAIERIYLPTSYTSETNEIMGSVVIELPKRVGDVNYNMEFENRSLFFETLGKPLFNQSCKIGFNASFVGSSSGGKVRLIWERYSNSTDVIRMERLS